jgi:DNA-binding FrmR family transcriptional regulator
VKGHIAGIEKMVEDGKSCEEVLTQILAIKSSVHKIGLMVMESHALECLLEPNEEGMVEAERMEHIIRMILQFSK